MPFFRNLAFLTKRSESIPKEMQTMCRHSASDEDDNVRGIKLSWSGLACVNWGGHDSSLFRFTDGHREIVMDTTMAEFLSPKVANLRRTDACVTTCKFTNTRVADSFELLYRSCLHGQPLYVGKSNFQDFVMLALEIGNSELLSLILAQVRDDWRTLDWALFQLKNAPNLLCALESVTEYVASKFYTIDEKALRELDLDALRAVLSHPSLKLKDEDSLYDVIKSRVVVDRSSASLMEFVCFEYLSPAKIQDCVAFIGEYMLDNMGRDVWARIARRLVRVPVTNPDDESVSARFVRQYETYHFTPSNPLDGIIAHLTRESGGNVHEKGIIQVTASSMQAQHYMPKEVVSLAECSVFFTRSEENSWICFDFKDRRVSPTNYSIRSIYDGGCGSNNLKSWTIEGSSDGQSWVVLDRRENDNSLNARNVTRNFAIASTESPSSYRFLRIHQTGKNHANNDRLGLSSLEIFGRLYEQKS